ncbi:MAG: DUF4190 domain-containing protein [Phycisphaerae bacterium]|nr:DUF4190 domain-containing protein [Phycisphaerae bacterium]
MPENQEPERGPGQTSTTTVVSVETLPVPAESAVSPHRRGSACVSRADGGLVLPGWQGYEKLALASAVCGLTAFVPVVAQVMGLILGIASLVRIHRARRRGIHLRGLRWALVGLFSSGFVLLCWVVVVVALLVVRGAFLHAADVLPTGG